MAYIYHSYYAQNFSISAHIVTYINTKVIYAFCVFFFKVLVQKLQICTFNIFGLKTHF